MASQVNHNAAYEFVVDGITVWDRLRVIRTFISSNKMNVEMAKLGMEEEEYKLSKLDDTKESDFIRRRHDITKVEALDAIKKAEDELKFLYKLEKDLVEKAEPTRIKGKTDDEMYEINYYHELTAKYVRKAHSEIIAIGHLTPATVELLMQCPSAMTELVSQDILNGNQILKLTNKDSGGKDDA